jgi:hypothetical protein
MSASALIAFFGVRYEITIDESEDNNDKRVQAVRKVGLQYYSGNFGGLGERYLLFIGKRIGILGAENKGEIILPVKDLQELVGAEKGTGNRR